MKKILFLSIIVLGIVGLTGCYTVPRHYAPQVEVIYYVPVEPPYPPEPIIDYPPPPPSPPVYYPPSTDPNPQRDRIPEKPKDSYGKRDPLQGGEHRGGGNTKTLPPVRTPAQKDRSSQ
jgi:hypothetical protein